MDVLRRKVLWAFLLISLVALSQAQGSQQPAGATLADVGLVYPLSQDWILATTAMRRQFAARNPSSGASVLLAAVYVPEKSKYSESSVSFSLLAFHHPDAGCKQVLDATVQHWEQQDKVRIGKADEKFSAGGREFYRTDVELKGAPHHRALICGMEKDYLLLWNAGARKEDELDIVVATLSSIAPAVSSKEPQAAAAGSPVAVPQMPLPTTPLRVRVSSKVMGGMLIKKVAPVYPDEARRQHIQGTVFLQAEINKEGDIVNLEAIEGPIELVGSAVDAVRQWKYRPYLLKGEPVSVETQIQVNYELRWN